jgi:hypothetical protein
MSMYGARLSITILIAALIAFVGRGSAFADSPSVTAVLSNSEVAVGETVRLQIRITGSGAKPPGQITVDGLEIRQTGTEQHYEMNNFSVSQSVVYNYTVLPMKAGKFKIPPQTVQVGGSTQRTQELTLNVTDSGGHSSQSNPNTAQQSPVDPKNIAFLELIVLQRVAYVGEPLPIAVRLGINTQTPPAQEWNRPEISTQGLTIQNSAKIERNSESINGRNYVVYTYKATIVPTRAGKFEISPLQEKIIVIIPVRREPQSQAPHRRSLLDVFDIDPLLGDLGRVQPREITLTSEPVTLQVKPLPPNAPASFSGAVGNFAMTAEANPKSVQVGDPITVTATISGRGNFDRVNAPSIEDDRGWHKYPPSSKFKQDDDVSDVGISGAKTFEIVLSPNEKKQAVPPLAFSYFDPVKEQYVTLRSEPVPIQVEGNALPAARLSAATANPQPAPEPSARPASKPQDILYQLTELPVRSQSFTPLYARSVFWMAQLIPLLALLGIAGWKIRQARIDNREAQRIAALQQEATELMRKLRRKDTSPQEYFSQASRAVQVKTALARNVDPNVVDVEVAAKTFGLDEGERAQLRRLFARSDEMRYSGAQNGAGTTTPQDRHELLEFIESLRA